jgi:hypothetical protein
MHAFLRLNFMAASFLFCPRACNDLADELAVVGVRRREIRSLWLNSLPADVFVLKTSMSAVSVK